ncbi:unnamed protein product [Polarella glacialis]|uniref:Uncharacterized protein n=1 Tax=Polarella glacialis TaxID=89957 RepID=A0A813LW66_POLGL|nr:unnamed protein product [Polarella glacialis]
MRLGKSAGPDVISVTSGLTAVGRALRWDVSLDLLLWLREGGCGLEPDLPACNAALTAVGEARQRAKLKRRPPWELGVGLSLWVCQEPRSELAGRSKGTAPGLAPGHDIAGRRRISTRRACEFAARIRFELLKFPPTFSGGAGFKVDT